ncbi:16S rRNA (uracil(1498)-N(3))-methyltransferase [Amphibacillus sediminis]|uniref:16S rRNA (uracil(1498)-N(3))-methyltransferase n=1 Tax=Amphibacillus sediminis TaxID=360185 RepID=UPI00082A58A5|nr:16S rRNA (uracil(1498)-N(3))-methyltransferase [Amphibacillus sediminis]
MQRYFVDQQNWDRDTVTITGDDVHHIARVMRMGIGDQVTCTNTAGRSAVCQIEAISDTIKLTILKWVSHTAELPIHVMVAQGIPKGDKFDFIIQKGTELGAHGFIPFQATRSIVKWDEKKQTKKRERWQKIAKEASEQAHRSILPSIKSWHNLNQLIQASQSFDHKFVAYEETTRDIKVKKLDQYYQAIQEHDSALFVIGPEGGLTESEVEKLYQAEFIPVRLGPRILRTETASLYALASLSYYFEETE